MNRSLPLLGQRLVTDGQQPGCAEQPRPLGGDEGRELRVALGGPHPISLS